jgi:flagellar biosynthetic protein FlhB
MHDTADRIHPPTPQRRRQAREQGNVARSHDLTSAIILICGVATLAHFGTILAGQLSAMLQDQLGGRAWLTLSAADVAPHITRLAWGLAATLLPILALLTVAATLSQLAQSRFLIFPQRAIFDLQRINPAHGFTRLFSLDGGVRALYGILKLVAVAALTAWCAISNQASITMAAAGDLATLGGTLGSIVLWTTMKISALLLALGVADYAWQWWRHERTLRMTTQEIRDEQRAQGSTVTAQRRSARGQQTAQEQTQNVARV